MRRFLSKKDAVIQIQFVMGKGEKTTIICETIELPFSPLCEFIILRSIEMDLNESFDLPDKPAMFEYDIRLFRDDFRTKFIIVPCSTWAIKAKKEKDLEHFYEDCFEEMIVVKKDEDDSTSAETTDDTRHLLSDEFNDIPCKNGPIPGFFRGSSVFDEERPVHGSEDLSSPHDHDPKPDPNINSGRSASSNDESHPITHDASRNTDVRPFPQKKVQLVYSRKRKRAKSASEVKATLSPMNDVGRPAAKIRPLDSS